ncbi:hypothetical protein Ahy_A10g047946 [Arachis hypogaea]|uniref:Uncharacterized protein n=1 Tax=Arachis hypogaea TaxID=3818 RepID=A0A445B3U8_ARAHY|nr:hypothetical protein Ahy_A10g047946 [Arachis hypogaea]
MLKQYRDLSMFVRHTIENNKKARVRPSKIYQSFGATTDCHWKLSFIEKDVRNYITREVRNTDDRLNFSMCILTRSLEKFKHNSEEM